MKKAVALFPLLVPAVALAQSTQIESGIRNAVPWLQGIGMAVSAVMLIICGMKFSSADPTAKDSAKSIFVGAILILGASGLMQLVKSWFGGG